MGRPKRIDLGGYVYHVLNRSNGQAPIFQETGDYEVFLRTISQALKHVPGMRLLSYCLMPSHWHLVLWPRKDGELSDFVHWLTLTHIHRWRAHHPNLRAGNLYQGRYRSFPIASNDHCLQVCRYVERNALRAGLVDRAQDWLWGSLAGRRGIAEGPPLSKGPLALPSQWLRLVNRPETQEELESVRRSVKRGQPFGSDAWVKKTCVKMNLECTLVPQGRPRIHPKTD